jgi:hypothetical protein
MFEQDTVYTVDHNGIPSFGYLRDDEGIVAYDLVRAWDLSEWDATQKGSQTTFKQYDAFYSIRPVELEDAKTVFPELIRTFPDVESLQNFAKKAIALSDSYTPNTVPDETVSFTIDDDGTVLDLIRVTENGEMYARDNIQWTRLEGEDHPTIIDKDLVDIDPDDVVAAIKMWDDASGSGSTLMESDILPMASAQQ